LVARVDELVPPAVWRGRFAHINAFERLLVDGGTTVIKFFLHISRQEQGQRLQERLDRPEKRWKLSPSDFAERKHWDAYQVAYADVLEQTSTKDAPWYVIPADHKWFRNWVVSKILVDTLESMDPHYPEPPPLGDVAVA
jgi:polyphosphate kinase 2 (PPK2 family)